MTTPGVPPADKANQKPDVAAGQQSRELPRTLGETVGQEGYPTEDETWGGTSQWTSVGDDYPSGGDNAGTGGDNAGTGGVPRDALVYNPMLSLLDESNAMLKYASARGLRLPAMATSTLQKAMRRAKPLSLTELARAHDALAKAVAPATPSTIKWLEEEQLARNIQKGARLPQFLGVTRYSRGLSAIAIVLFAAFVVTQYLFVTITNPPRVEVISTALASLIGGVFFSLFSVNRQLSEGTFERSREGYYTTLIILGGLSGMTLAFLIIQPTDAPVPGANDTEQVTVQVLLQRPLLALLGGFSASAVYRILERLVTAVENLFGTSVEGMVAAQQQVVESRAATSILESQEATIARLSALRVRLIAADASVEATKAVDALVADLLSAMKDGQPTTAQDGA